MLKWIFERCDGQGDADLTPIGYVPGPDALDLLGLAISQEDLNELLRVDKAEWIQEAEGIAEYYRLFGNRLPKAIESELAELKKRMNA